jgi:hypothetical protein
MKVPFSLTCGALAVLGSLTVSAQTPAPAPAPPQTPSPSPSSPARSDDTRQNNKMITVTGCLKTADASMTGGSAAGPTGGSPGRYVLMNSEDSGDSKAGGTPRTPTPSSGTTPGTTPGAPPGTASGTTPGSAADAAATASGKQYAVVADGGVSLAQHVNHQVRVTGRLAEASSMTPGSGSRPTGTPDAPGRSPDGAKANTMPLATLTVTSVTMVSNTCPAAH